MSHRRLLYIKMVRGIRIMNIYLVRHGETDWNSLRKYQGRIDIELNDKGIGEAHLAGKKLESYGIDCIYSSTLKRAMKTAEIINSYVNAGEIITTEEIIELNLGQWEGKTWDEIQEEYKEFLKTWMTNRVKVKIPGGESYGDAEIRGINFLRNLVNSCSCENVVVISHGALIAAVLCSILSIDANHEGNFRVDNCAVNHISYDKKEDKFSVVTLNDISHLRKK